MFLYDTMDLCLVFLQLHTIDARELDFDYPNNLKLSIFLMTVIFSKNAMLFTFTLEGVSFNLFFLLLWEAEKKKEKILMNGFWGKNGKRQKNKK